MSSTSHHHGSSAAPNQASAEAIALLNEARAMQLAARLGQPAELLRGKQLGLLRATGRRDETAVFLRAARALGARVAILQHGLCARTPAVEVRETARVLGRLYDAIECQGLGRRLVRRIEQAAGVPVFNGLGLPNHPSAAWLDRLPGPEADAEKRCFLVQARLLRELAGRGLR